MPHFSATSEISSDFSLQGQLALVTGASRGIGRALALNLARRGAHIIAVARNSNDLEQLDDEIATLAGSATLVALNLRDMSAIDQLGHTIHDRWGRLDILIANAAILGPVAPIAHIEAQDFDAVISLNITSQWRLMRTVEPLLRRAPQGRVVVLSSSAAHRIRAFWGAYALSKAAVEALARSWAEELKQTSIKVNCVNPGATRTAMRAAAMPGENPLTLPTAEEVAARIAPLTSPHLTQSGQLFDVRQNRFLSYHLPD